MDYSFCTPLTLHCTQGAMELLLHRLVKVDDAVTETKTIPDSLNNGSLCQAATRGDVWAIKSHRRSENVRQSVASSDERWRDLYRLRGGHWKLECAVEGRQWVPQGQLLRHRVLGVNGVSCWWHRVKMHMDDAWLLMRGYA